MDQGCYLVERLITQEEHLRMRCRIAQIPLLLCYAVHVLYSQPIRLRSRPKKWRPEVKMAIFFGSNRARDNIHFCFTHWFNVS